MEVTTILMAILGGSSKNYCASNIRFVNLCRTVLILKSLILKNYHAKIGFIKLYMVCINGIVG